MLRMYINCTSCLCGSVCVCIGANPYDDVNPRRNSVLHAELRTAFSFLDPILVGRQLRCF